MITRGFSSETFAYNAAVKFQEEADRGREIVIIYIGDLDPAGLHMEKRLQEIISEFVTFDVDSFLTWNRLFVTEEQRDVTMASELHGLGTPAKGVKSFGWIGGEAIEAEAIEPDVFRQSLTDAIEEHVDQRQLEILRAVEAEEKAGLMALSKKLRPTKKLLELREELTEHNRTLGWEI